MEEYKSFVVRRRRNLEREREQKRKLQQKKDTDGGSQPELNPDYQESKLTSRSSMEDLLEQNLMTPKLVSVQPFEATSPRNSSKATLPVSKLDSSRKTSNVLFGQEP